jgi:hypothetical protein
MAEPELNHRRDQRDRQRLLDVVSLDAIAEKLIGQQRTAKHGGTGYQGIPDSAHGLIPVQAMRFSQKTKPTRICRVGISR